MAKNEFGADGVMDLASVQQKMKDAMNDPQFLESMGGMADGMGDMMAQLQNMDTSELMAQMQEGLKMLTNPDMLNTIMGQKEEVFASLKEQGLVDDETLQKYEADPDFFEQEMAKAFEQMTDIFSSPEAMQAATEMMKGYGDLMANPEETMKEIANFFTEELGDDDKIEQARLQLLNDPEKAGHPALAEMFAGEEMQEVLRDPEKFREQVKIGQGMLLNGDNFGMGEL